MLGYIGYHFLVMISFKSTFTEIIAFVMVFSFMRSMASVWKPPGIEAELVVAVVSLQQNALSA